MTSTDRLAALEQRIAYLEDQEKIRELLARYGFNADLGRAEEYLDVWTDDGIYDSGAAPMVGKDALREMITSPTGFHKSEVENRSLHTVGNLYIAIEGDTAWAEGYSVVWLREGAGYKALTAGYNHWDFKRAADGWRMTRRLRRNVGDDEWGGETIKAYLGAGPA